MVSAVKMMYRRDISLQSHLQKQPNWMVSRFSQSSSGPLNCLSASHHQILAKSAPQKAGNQDKAEFATNVRKSSEFDLNPKNLKGHI